jgi:hypothetical protein
LPEHIAADIRAVHAHSMYVFNYSGLLYYLANTPLPTRYPHPPMLTSNLEAASFGVDAQQELSTLLQRNPDMVVLQTPISPRIPRDRQDIILTKLQDNYCLWRSYAAGLARVNVYADAARKPELCSRTRLSIADGSRPDDTKERPIPHTR